MNHPFTEGMQVFVHGRLFTISLVESRFIGLEPTTVENIDFVRAKVPGGERRTEHPSGTYKGELCVEPQHLILTNVKNVQLKGVLTDEY